MNKFGRNYELTINFISEGEPSLIVSPPFTLEFDVIRKTLGMANMCHLRIYNLSKLNRNRVRFNIFNRGIYRQVSLKAGYGNNIAEIFKGNMSQAWSHRQGTDWITEIICLDGGFAYLNGETAKTFTKGTPERVVVASVMQDLPFVKVGAIGGFDGVLSRGITVSGNTKSILSEELTGGAFFIDKEKAYALKTNEYLAGKPILIDARSGLLGTPILEQTIARFEMLFEPQLNLGSTAILDSITGDNYNGIYKIVGIEHRGIISGAIAGSAITIGEFFYDKSAIPVK